MWLFDAFDSPWYFDALDSLPGTNYVQQANGVISLSGDGGQEWAGDYVQNVDCTLFVFGGAVQSWVAPAGPQAYLQNGNGLLVLFGGSLQEHSPVFGGQFGQTGNGVITLTGGALQQHAPGANPGELLQIGSGVIALMGGALQSHTPPEFVRLVVRDLDSVLPYGSSSVTPVPFSFGAPPPSVSRITMSFSSNDPLFNVGVGPTGGGVFVEIALRASDRLPLVSVSAAKPVAEFFLGQTGAAFNALVAAVSDGHMDLEVSAYEAGASRVTPLMLGSSSLQVEVLP